MDPKKGDWIVFRAPYRNQDGPFGWTWYEFEAEVLHLNPKTLWVQRKGWHAPERVKRDRVVRIVSAEEVRGK